MNKTIQILLILVLVSSSLSARNKRVSAFIFSPSWSMGLQTGTNFVVAEGHEKNDWIYHPGFSFQPTFSYQFVPAVAFRASASVNVHRWNNRFVIPKNTIWTFSSETLQADVLLNLNNMFSYYTLLRKIEVSVFGGTGVLLRNSMSMTDDNGYLTYLGRAGIQCDYRLSQKLSFNLAGEMNITGDNFNGFDAGKRKFELVPKILLGISYHFR